MNEEKIYILVPTRDRRASLDTLIKSFKETTRGRSVLVLIIDEDQYDLYKDMFLNEISSSILFMTLERRNLAPKLNKAVELLKKEPVLGYGFMGDDCVFVTSNWEYQIFDQLCRYKGLCYCNDLLKGEELPNNVFIHSDIIRKLGFICPLGLKHYYIDNYWKDLGLRIHNIHYFPKIIIEHRHHANGKAEKDALYQESEKNLDADKIAYDEYVTSGKLAADARRINYGNKFID